MGRRKSPTRERAHCALEDWASFKILTLTSQEMGYQIAQLDVERVQTPPKALIPRVTFTPPTVKCIDNYMDQATESLKETAIKYYLGPIEIKRQVTRRQYDYLIGSVTRWLTGLCK